MFDLDLMEKDYKENSFRLSEEEIMKIYCEEGITEDKYEEEIQELIKKGKVLTAEERLLNLIFNEEFPKSKENITPPRKYLSNVSQKKVIEGSLYMVFDLTREWYNFLEGKLSMEKIYYICLESLISSVKYMRHCMKPVFYLYVSKSTYRNIVKYIAKQEHITYREAYKIVDDLKPSFDDKRIKALNSILNKEYMEIQEKPSKIYYQKRNEEYNVNYIKNISSFEFMKEYKKALNNFDELTKIIMSMSFDINGNRGLSINEISDYLGIESKKVINIRKKAIKSLRKNPVFNNYLS